MAGAIIFICALLDYGARYALETPGAQAGQPDLILRTPA
jgi:hypothetical protein